MVTFPGQFLLFLPLVQMSTTEPIMWFISPTLALPPAGPGTNPRMRILDLAVVICFFPGLFSLALSWVTKAQLDLETLSFFSGGRRRILWSHTPPHYFNHFLQASQVVHLQSEVKKPAKRCFNASSPVHCTCFLPLSYPFCYEWHSNQRSLRDDPCISDGIRPSLLQGFFLH